MARRTLKDWLAPMAPLIALGAIIVLVFAMGWHQYLSLDTVRDHGAWLKAFTAEHYALALLIYLAAYAALTTTAIPGAVFLTLTGGFLFGPWVGAVTTSAGATIGAIGVYYVVHSAIGAWLREKAERDQGLLKRICDGIDANTFVYTLTVRLIPSVPFILINISAGLVSAPLRPYAAATFIGILPATFIYSWIGAGLDALLARGEDLSLASIVGQFFWPLMGVAFLSLGLPLGLRLLRKAGLLPESSD